MALLPLGQSLACANFRNERPLLGKHSVADAALAQLVLIQQRDADLTVLVKHRDGEVLHDSPGGRNGTEWIYIAPNSGAVELCFHSSIRQAYRDAFRLQVVDVAAASRQQREALQAMDAAGVLWARRTLGARKAAAQQYSLAAAKGDAVFHIADHAKLYAALAVATYDRNSARADLESLAAHPSKPDYIRYMARWAPGSAITLNQPTPVPANITALTEASLVAGKLGFARDHAAILNRLAELHIASGDLPSGEEYLRRARLLAGSDEQLLGHVHNNLGLLYLEQSKHAQRAKAAADLGRSLQEHFTARRHMARVDDRDALWFIENNIAHVAERLGDLRNAVLHYRAALALIDSTQDPFRTKVVYAALGRLHLNLGGYNEAEQYTAHALSIARQSEPDDFMNLLLCSLGTIQQLQGRLKEAIQHHQACHDAAVQAGSARRQAQALHELAEDHQRAGNQEQAWRAIAAARSLLDQGMTNAVRAKVLTHHALMAQRYDERELARSDVQHAIDAARELAPTLRIQPFAAAMKIFAEQNLHAEATHYGLNALNAIEAVHTTLDKESLAPAWSAQNETVYATLTAILLERYAGAKDPALLELAFEIVERSEAVSLRQQLGMPRAAAQRVAESAIVQSLSELANAQASAAAPTASLAYRHQHDLLTLARLSGSNVPVPAPLKLQHLRKLLGPRQVALSYFFADERLWLFYLTREGLQLFELGSRHAVERLIDQLRKNVDSRQEIARPLQQLADVLLPRAVLDGNAEWIIARYGSLQSVPFGALPMRAGSASKPVLMQHLVKMVPSLSAYFMGKPGRIQDLPLDLAVFADPAFSRRKPDDQAQGRPPKGWTQTLTRLPATAREARSLRSYFDPARASIFVDSQATRANLRSRQARSASVLHIATHGYFRSSDPDIVGFALAESVEAGSVDSGFVTLTELFTQNFDNELVVISGCDSALGAQRGGEGMNSLTRGFIAQGVSHVVSTLWAIPDRVAADFMGIFYRRLSEHQSVALALQQAQEELRDPKHYPDPYFWAPYQLTTVSPGDRIKLRPAKLAAHPATTSGPVLTAKRAQPQFASP